MVPLSRTSAALVCTVLLVGCGPNSGSHPTTHPSSPTTAVASKLIDYTDTKDQMILIREPADVSKLVGAPQDFKDFMTEQITELSAGEEPGDECATTIDVQAIQTSGFATGGIGGCGGAAIMWGKPNGKWTQIWGGQIMPDCATMEKYSVPKDLYAITSHSISSKEDRGKCAGTKMLENGWPEMLEYKG